MKTVLLYGFLGKQFGRVHRYDINSPAEAIRAMCVTLEGFRKAVIDGGAYRVLVGGKDALSLDRTEYPVSDKETIRIVPVVAGAGGGFGQVILGAILIAAAVYTGGASLTLTSAVTTTFMGKLGAALIIGGVSQMLFAPDAPKAPAEKPENMPSYAFDGAVNTTAQGNPVPILYGGPLIIGSQVISAGLSAEAWAIPTEPTLAQLQAEERAATNINLGLT